MLEASELREGGAATPRPPPGPPQPPQLFSAWGASEGMCPGPAALPKVYEADSSLPWLPVCNTHLCACACMCVRVCVLPLGESTQNPYLLLGRGAGTRGTLRLTSDPFVPVLFVVGRFMTTLGTPGCRPQRTKHSCTQKLVCGSSPPLWPCSPTAGAAQRPGDLVWRAVMSPEKEGHAALCCDTGTLADTVL